MAELFDASCAVGQPGFDQLADKAFTIWNSILGTVTTQQLITLLEGIPFISGLILGQHYFSAHQPPN